MPVQEAGSDTETINTMGKKDAVAQVIEMVGAGPVVVLIKREELSSRLALPFRAPCVDDDGLAGGTRAV
jgi:hypothetical protein